MQCGSAFAPIIEYVTNLVYNLMKAIQSLVYAFSGINIFAKATASSMKNTSKSAKDTNKSLSSVHSEINNVSEKNNNGSGISSPNIDLSQIDSSMNSWIAKIKEKLTELFQPIQNSWIKYGQPLIESMKYAFNSNLELIKEIGKSFEEVWTNGTGEQTISTILQLLTSILNTCGNINTAFKNAWQNSGGTEIIQNLWNALNNILNIVLGVQQTFEEWTASESFQTFANAIIEICVTLSYWFELITGKIKEIWENGGKETFTKLLDFISKLVELIDVVLKALSPVVEFVLNTVTPVIEGIIKVIGYVIDALSGVLDFIIGIFTGDWERAWNGIKEFFTGIWNAIKTIVSTVWNTITNIIFNIINGIKTTISNVLNTIKSVWDIIWNSLKTTVSNIFNGIWNAIKNVINWILGGIEKMGNGVVNGINTVIKALNRLSFKMPDWLGGGQFGFNIKTLNTISLPRLAKGNVAYSPLIAQFGEYTGASHNPEITAPQNVLRETFDDVLSDHEWNNNNNSSPIQLSVYVGNKKLGEILLENLRDKKRQTGKNIEALVGG